MVSNYFLGDPQLARLSKKFSHWPNAPTNVF